MNIDAKYAQIQELNDAKIQQIKAQRKLLGGIIKKGDPIYKNSINIILFALLLPCMIIFELLKGFQYLLIYIWESRDFLRNSIIKKFRRVNTCLSANYYFAQKCFIQRGNQITLKIVCFLRICLSFITKRYLQFKIIINYYSQLFIKNVILILFKWIQIKFQILYRMCKVYLKSAAKSMQIRFLLLMQFMLKYLKFIITKAKQIELIVFKYFKKFLISVKWKIKQFKIYILQKIKWASELFYQNLLIPALKKLKHFSIHFYTMMCIMIKKLQKKCQYYLPLIVEQMKIKFLLGQKWMLLRIAELHLIIKYLKDKLIHFYLILIDKLLEKYRYIKLNIISPVNHKIQNGLKYIKVIIIDLLSKTLIIIKQGLLCSRNIIIKATKKLVNIYRNGQQRRSKRLSLKVKQIYNQMRKKAILTYQKLHIFIQFLQFRIKIVVNITFIYIKHIWIQLTAIPKSSLKQLKAFSKFIKKNFKTYKENISKLFKWMRKQILSSIELSCKIIVKFIMIKKMFEPILQFIDKVFEILFYSLSQPYLLFNKLIYTGIDIILYQEPNWLYDHIVNLLRKLKQFIIKLVRLIELIIRQTKKIMIIINSKLLNPFIKMMVKNYVYMRAALVIVVQQLINFKDMIKYNYILPYWASVRLFGVKIRLFYIQIKKILVIIMSCVGQQLKLLFLYMKVKIIVIKTQIIYNIMLCFDSMKYQYKTLIQKIYEILKGPLINLKNASLQILISFQQIICNLIQKLKDLIFAQFLLIKELVIATVKSITYFSNQGKEFIIEQLNCLQLILQNIYDQLQKILISTYIQIAQQMEQVMSSLIQQKNVIVDQFMIVEQNIKLQGIHIKDGIFQMQNDLSKTILLILKRN